MMIRIVAALVVSLLSGAAIACNDTPSPTPILPTAVVEPTPQPTAAAPGVVTGTVTYRERIALSPQAVVDVKLVDISRADAPATTIGEHVIENPGQVPISFEIEYDPDDIDERFSYAVQARIMEGERLAFINDTAYHVITRGSPTHVDMVLVQVGEPGAPSEKEKETAVFEVGPCAMTAAAQLPVEFEYKGTVPTGFDGINKANCTFTKPVETVTVTLTGPATHVETFTLSEPSTQVSFPLPEGTLSITTQEIVPPGVYQREMTVTSVDGETLVISDQPGVLETVTILEPVVFEVGPCLTTLAAQLPVEFEYKGTVPTGFDGINKANCTFTKEVMTVTVTLTGPATHTETFTLSVPSTEVSFPLPEGTLSITTLEIVPPGVYQREMTATSVDGDSLVISDQPGILKTVTILEPVAFEVGPCRMTRAAQLPIEIEYKGTIPTGFDGINKANCTFTKEVKTVTVTLTGPATHTETFTLSEPSTEVSFPLPEGTLSITTLEIVPPGVYQREMTATSVDGETLVISDQPGVLETVTILEPVAFEVGPCLTTLAAQLPIEFEYKGTIPTGFDGINKANCTFTKPVQTVTVTLTGPATHTETFTLSEPSTEVSFPLPEGTLSITTLEIVPPGEYQREMTATSVDGGTLVISDQPGVLKTVTIVETTEFTFSFENDDQGWLTGFADLPADFDQSTFELDSGHQPLPAGLEGSGMYLQGHNRSDDLFMFLKSQVAGLRPDTAYAVTVSLDLATNVPAGLVGIGGSPGESVYVKAGVSAVEPLVEEDDAGYLRMNIDKGNQATEGEAMINLGNVAHPEVTGDEYKIKTLHNQGRPLEVVSDNEGQIWLIVATDSGFEGLSAFYYARITYIFTTL